MRLLSVQVQPNLAPELNMQALSAAFEVIALNGNLVAEHNFESSSDEGPYFNFTFSTNKLVELWDIIQESIYGNAQLGPQLLRSSMAICTGKFGWDDYLLLFHFDPAEKKDDLAAL